MVEPNKTPIVCRNGHRQPNADSRFCIYCGISLNTPPPQQITPQPAIPTAFPQQNAQQQNVNPQLPVNQYPQPFQNLPAPIIQAVQCRSCGGDGQRLNPQTVICQECGWLRPLIAGYGVDCSAFQWSEDGKAMSVLRSITPLTLAAQTISDKVGRRWIETTFNGVLLSEKQLPEVYAQAVRAARILAMTHMPDVYVSGEMMWDCRTFGSNKDAFIVMGSALATNFRGPELLFLFAREMGHCRAGHALWKTVIKFLLGEQGPRKGLMAGGLFAALSPTALIEGALEMPLLGWARQAEITADRAGLLVVGDEAVARNVLLSWSLKSPFLYRQINVDAWLKQQGASDDSMTKLSELTTSSTPYITRRLKLMAEFAQSPDLKRWQTVISSYAERVAPAAVSGVSPQKPPQADSDLRIKCSNCRTPMRVPLKILEGKQQMSIRCPNAKCGKLTMLKKSVKSASAENKTPAPMPNKLERSVNYDE
ncbi:hypothetical protein BH18ACI1_BH18ACI1_23010 [soil metagenome]